MTPYHVLDFDYTELMTELGDACDPALVDRAGGAGLVSVQTDGQPRIVNARRRLELMALLAEPGRFDFDAAEEAWGGTD